VKISETLAEVRKLIGRMSRQNLPTGPDTPTFSSLLSDYAKTHSQQSRSDTAGPAALTLRDYRSQALPVRVNNGRGGTGKESKQIEKTILTTISKVPERIQQVIEDAARKYQIPAEIIRAIVKVESNFNPQAVSSEGARGLMQLMPATAKELGVKNSFDIRENVEAGSRYFKEMLDRFDGKIELALAAYNAGPGAVSRHKGIPPYRETQNYVKKVMAYC
jgi:soluble lytic murein transglycosylase-like protein